VKKHRKALHRPLLLACVMLSVSVYGLSAQSVGGSGAAASVLISIPGGEFIMGRDGAPAETDDYWTHRVSVSGFRLGATEVTNRDLVAVYNQALRQGLIEVRDGSAGTANLYDKASDMFLLTTWNSKAPGGFFPRPELKDGLLHISDEYSLHPAVRISWYAAAAYCNYRSRFEGLQPVFDDQLESFDVSRNGYRLPSEAEWEYAARERGSDIVYPWGSGEPNANIADRSYKKTYPQHSSWTGYDDGFAHTAPVASFGPNSLGLYDMGGNAAEWCINWFYRYPGYGNSAFLVDPFGPESPDSGAIKTYRGGSWYEHGVNLVATNRGWYSPDNPGSVSDLGFRVARSGE
jgi:formylglycine-generating enzyme required for sulfatase activity